MDTARTPQHATSAGRFTLPALMLCAFFGSATFTSVSPFLNEMAADLHQPIGVVGQLASISALAAALSALLIFSSIEQISPRRLLLAAASAVGLFSLLTGLIVWLPALLALQFVVGGAATTTTTTALVILGRLYPDPASRARRQGFLIGMSGCGPLIGTPLLRLIAADIGWQGAIAIYGSVALGAVAVASLALPAVPAARLSSGAPASAGRLREALNSARLPLVGRTLTLSAMLWLAWGVMGGYLAGFVADAYPGRSALIGAFWVADGISYMIGAFGSGIIILRLGGATRAIGIGMSAMVVAISTFVWLPLHPVWSLALYVLWMGLMGVTNSSLINLLYQFSHDRQGPVLFLGSAIGRLGTFGGGVLGGITLQLTPGFSGWSALMAGVSLLALAPLATLLRGVEGRSASQIAEATT